MTARPRARAAAARSAAGACGSGVAAPRGAAPGRGGRPSRFYTPQSSKVTTTVFGRGHRSETG
eukprot:scaffold22779_cov67-Phaeocystis_antarctica.AAC.3